MPRPLPNTLVCAFALTLVAGCADPLDTEELTLDEEQEEIVENLELAGYPASEIEVVEDQVIVGGDAVVSLRASREMAGVDGHEDGFRQYRSRNLVDAEVEVICVDLGDLLPHPALFMGATGAIASYNSQQLSFTLMGITHAANTSQCDAVITAIASEELGTSADAGFPEDGEPYDQIQMGTGIAAFGIDVSRHVFMHELGHCVGLRHTDYFDRSFSCGEGGNEGGAGVGANHIPGTPTAYDALSVMNACYTPNSQGVWSPHDRIALHALYAEG